MPLKASLDNKFFYSENLESEHRKLIFKCPICEVDLIPVIPKKDIIKHFRHKTGHAHGEPDGPEHRAMKVAVKTKADKLGLFSDYEVRLVGEKTRITDVKIIPGFVSKTIMGYGGIAVECQCASMSIDEYAQRNIDYNLKGYKPLWILGERYFTWSGNNPKKLVKEIIKDNGVCFFYIKGSFHKCELDKEHHKSGGSTFNYILMYVSGFYDLKKQITYLEEEVEKNIKTSFDFASENGKLRKEILIRGKQLGRTQNEISRLESQKRQLNILNNKIQKRQLNILNNKIQNIQPPKKREHKTIDSNENISLVLNVDDIALDINIDVDETDSYKGKTVWQLIDLMNFFKKRYEAMKKETKNLQNIIESQHIKLVDLSRKGE